MVLILSIRYVFISTLSIGRRVLQLWAAGLLKIHRPGRGRRVAGNGGQNAGECPEGPELPDWQHQDVSAYVLSCLKELNENYPEPTELSGVLASPDTLELGLKFMEQLQTYGVLGARGGRFYLTRQGRAGFLLSAGRYRLVAGCLRGGSEAVPSHKYHEVLLDLLRAYFERRKGYAPVC